MSRGLEEMMRTLEDVAQMMARVTRRPPGFCRDQLLATCDGISGKQLHDCLMVVMRLNRRLFFVSSIQDMRRAQQVGALICRWGGLDVKTFLRQVVEHPEYMAAVIELPSLRKVNKRPCRKKRSAKGAPMRMH